MAQSVNPKSQPTPPHADAEPLPAGEASGINAPPNNFRRLDHRVLTALIRFTIRVYRLTLSPIIGNQCRFLPTCSQYMLDAVDKYGPYRGFLKGLRRISRCHPLGGSGYDPA